MLGNAFTGNNTLLEFSCVRLLITAHKSKAPLVHESYFNNYICDVSCQDNVFILECFGGIYCCIMILKKDNRESYEHRVQSYRSSILQDAFQGHMDKYY